MAATATFKDDAPLKTGSKQQSSIDERLPSLIKNGNFKSAGSHAQCFLQLTKTWDSGGKKVRERILQEFVLANQNKTGPQLEQELANGASLFLTRLNAWLRLTYLVSDSIALQIQAISVFISAASGHRYLAEFLETGGVLTILEITSLSRATEVDRTEALRLLVHIANTGRKYKEFICESYGVRAIAECLHSSKSEVTQDHAKNLLIQLGTGNPKYLMQVYKALVALLSLTSATATAQQMACQTLRHILPAVPSVHASVADVTVQLLKSLHIQLQYQAYELLRELCTRPEMGDPIITQLITILRTNVAESDESDENAPGHGKPGQLKRSVDEIQKRTIILSTLYIQQAYAARLIGYMSVISKELGEKIISYQAVSGLLNVIANLDHSESQKYAANALLYLVDNYPLVSDRLEEQMGTSFLELCRNRPDTFFRELNKQQIYYLRKNTVRVYTDEQIALEENSGEDLFDAHQRIEESEEEKARTTRQNGTHRAPATKAPEDLFAQQAVVEQESTKPATAVAKPPVDEMARDNSDRDFGKMKRDLYAPYAQMNQLSTFPSSKFSPSSKLDAKEVFEVDLDKFKKTTLQGNSEKIKESFSVSISPDTIERLEKLQSADLFRAEAPLPDCVTTSGI